MQKTVVLDLGGTIVNEELLDSYSSVPEYLIKKSGLDANVFYQHIKELIQKLIFENQKQEKEQITSEYMIKKWCKDTLIQLDVFEIEEVFYHLFGGDASQYLQPLWGAQDLLAYFDSCNMTMIGLSNTVLTGRLLKKFLSTHGIGHFFSYFILSSEVGFRKPCKEIYSYVYEICAKKNLEIELFIGNHYECDILPALNDNYKAILIGKAVEDKRAYLCENLEGTLITVKKVLKDGV